MFEHDGKTYSVVSESNTVGLAAMSTASTCAGRPRAACHRRRAAPGQLHRTRNGKFKRSASFDWAAGQVELIDGDKKQTVQLPPEHLGRSSFAWNFAFSRSDGKDLQVYVTDGRRVTEYSTRFSAGRSSPHRWARWRRCT